MLSDNYKTDNYMFYNNGIDRLDLPSITNFTEVNELNEAPSDFTFAVVGFKTPIRTYYTSPKGLQSFMFPTSSYLYWTIRLTNTIYTDHTYFRAAYGGFYGYKPKEPLMNAYDWELYAGEASKYNDYVRFVNGFNMDNMCVVPIIQSINPSKVDENGNYSENDTEYHSLEATPGGYEVLTISFRVYYLFNGTNIEIKLNLKPFLVNVPLYQSYYKDHLIGGIKYFIKGPFPGIMYTAAPWCSAYSFHNPRKLVESDGGTLTFKSPNIKDDKKPYAKPNDIYDGYYITSFLPDDFLQFPTGKVGWIKNTSFVNSIIKLLQSTTLRYSIGLYKNNDDWKSKSYIPRVDENGNPTYESDPYNDSPRKNDRGFNDNWQGLTPSAPNPLETDPSKTINGVDPPEDNTNKIPTLNLFNRTFALTKTQVKSLAAELWNADESKFQEILKGLALMGGNPIQALIDLRAYPIDFSQWASSIQPITCGRTVLKASGLLIETSTIPQFNVDLGIINGVYSNFMDFEPFSKFQIYMPFVGTRDIPSNLIIGHNIKLKASVDITTGAISYIVYADNYPILYENGTIGVSIPMTSDNAAEYAANVIHATNNMVQTTASTVKTVANDAAGLMNPVSGMTNPASNVAAGVGLGADIIAGRSAIATAGFDLSTTLNQTTIQQSGCASPANSLYTPMSVYILQEFHNPVIPSNYAHDIGRACRKSGKISSFSGYTVFSNADLSGIPCTEAEKTIILQTLQNGVYL